MKLHYSSSAKVPLPPARRLVFLVPCVELDELALGRQVWELALALGSCLLFVTVVKDF